MRPPDAWSQRATGILQGDPAASVGRDSSRGARWIKRAVRFQAALANATSDIERIDVMADFPEIYWANWFHKAKLCPERLLIPYGIEARIIARQTDVDIAQGYGCRPDYIEAYEALFFNVRDRLDNRDFICNSILGQQVTDDKQHQQYDRPWKLVAYQGGPLALDAVMCGSSTFTWVQRPEDVPEFFGNLVRATLQQKIALASQLISPAEALCLGSSKTRNGTVKTKRGTSPKVPRSKRTAKSTVEACLKPVVLQSVPCETVGEVGGPMTTRLEESDEVRVSESV